MEKKARNSNFEILRFVSMLLIVAHHFAMHSGLPVEGAGAWDQLAYAVLRFGGKFGVDCFILIAGYFLVKDTVLDFGRVLRLESRLVVFSVAIYSALAIAGEISFSWLGFLRSFFPLVSNVWWFMTVYTVLYLLHPFLNLALKRMTKRVYLLLLGIMFALWLFLPQIGGLDGLFGYNDLVFFVFLYCLAGYFSLHGLPKIKRFLYLVAALLSFAFVVAYYMIVIRHPDWGVYRYFAGNPAYFFDMQRIPLVLCSMSVFLLFAGMKPRCSRAVNIAASATFGIYLLHDHEMMRPVLWVKLFRGAEMMGNPLFFLYGIGAVLAVFAASMAIDLIYTYAIEVPIGKLLKKIPSRISEKLRVRIEPKEAAPEPLSEQGETSNEGNTDPKE